MALCFLLICPQWYRIAVGGIYAAGCTDPNIRVERSHLSCGKDAVGITETVIRARKNR